MNLTLKKMLVVSALVGTGLAAGGWQLGKSASDEEAIKARSDAFAAAWNKNATAVMAAIWSIDGDLINPWGRVAKGRAAVETLFKDEHAMMMKGSHFEQRVTGVRTIGGGNVAVVDWEVTLTNTKGPDSAVQPPMHHHVAVVMQKGKDGTWMIETARPYVFLPVPQSTGKGGATERK